MPVRTAPRPTYDHDPRIVDDLNRRRLLGVGAGVFAGALLTACGPAGGPGSGPQSADDGATRTVTTPLGTYDVPVAPRRVIAVDSRLELEPALALGLPVVGHGYDQPAPWVPAPPNSTFVGAPVDLEQVLRLEPDLVLCTNLDNETWPSRRLAEIAPVLTTEFTDPWRTNLNRLADWLGGPDRAATALVGFEAELDRVRAAHADLIASRQIAAVAWYAPELMPLHTVARGVLPPQVCTDLGCRMLDLSRYDDVTPAVRLPAERWEELAGADGILVLAAPGTEIELAEHSLWRALPAVAAGHTTVIDERCYFGSVYSATRLLQGLDELYGTLRGA